MLGHLGVNVPNLEQAGAYYGPLMPLLGYERFVTGEEAIAFMPADGGRGAYLFFYGATQDGDYARERTGLQHLAFAVRTRGSVHDVHAHVRRGRQHGPPRAAGVAAVPASVFRHLLAGSLRVHARGRLPSQPRLTGLGVAS